PVEFLSFFSLPVTLGAGGGAGIVAKLGTGLRGQQIIGTLRHIATRANQLELITNPIGGVAAFGIRRGTSAVWKKLLNKPSLPRQEMNIANPVSETIPLADRAAWVKQQTIDELYPVTRLAKRTGNQDPDRLAHNMAGNNRIAEEFAENGPINFTTKERTGTPGMTQTLAELGSANKAGLDDLLVARRVVELTERGIEHGQSLTTTRAVLGRFLGRNLDELPSKAEYKSMSRQAGVDSEMLRAMDSLDSYNRDLMRHGHAAGLMDDEALASILSRNEFYAPFLREGFVDAGGVGGAGLRGPGSPVKSIKGSERRVLSPTDSMLLNTYRMIKESELNDVGKAIGDLADLPDSGVRTAQRPTELRAHATSDEALKGAGVDVETRRAIALDNEFDADLGVPIYRGANNLPEDMISFVKNGKRQYLKVDDMELARAYSALRIKPDSELPMIFKPTAAIARMQRAGITLDPGFVGMNVFRDQFVGFIQSNYGFVPGWDFMKGLAHYLGKSKFYDDMKTSGALRATLIGASRKELQKNLLKSI
ncbi:hypothetical protein LCGC14_2396480, partial [marine sediment metagenome]